MFSHRKSISTVDTLVIRRCRQARCWTCHYSDSFNEECRCPWMSAPLKTFRTISSLGSTNTHNVHTLHNSQTHLHARSDRLVVINSCSASLKAMRAQPVIDKHKHTRVLKTGTCIRYITFGQNIWMYEARQSDCYKFLLSLNKRNVGSVGYRQVQTYTWLNYLTCWTVHMHDCMYEVSLSGSYKVLLSLTKSNAGSIVYR